MRKFRATAPDGTIYYIDLEAALITVQSDGTMILTQSGGDFVVEDDACKQEILHRIEPNVVFTCPPEE